MKVFSVFLAFCIIVSLSRAVPVNSTLPWKISLCEYQRQQCGNSLGADCPQCDPSGNFLPKQCSGGYCWCVDIFSGHEIPETLRPQGTKLKCGAKKSCPDGWSSFGDKCLIFIDTPKKWTDAEIYCRFDGATLASIHSEEENHFITSLTRGDTHNFPQTWLGGFDAVQPGFWMWSDGSDFTYKNWDNPDPYSEQDDDKKDGDSDEKDNDEDDEEKHKKDNDNEEEDNKDSKNKKNKKHNDDKKYEKDDNDDNDDNSQEDKNHGKDDDDDNDDKDKKDDNDADDDEDDNDDSDEDKKHEKDSDGDDDDDDDGEDDEDDDDSDGNKKHDDDNDDDEDDEEDNDEDDEDNNDNEDDNDNDEDDNYDNYHASDEKKKKKNQHCLRINYDYGLKWFYASCTDALPFVCAKKAEDDD